MAIRVYYLDDESALCSIFSDCFSAEDIIVTTFTEAADAITTCTNSPPDIIFIDMRLTDTTGDQVAMALDDAIEKVLITGDLSYQSQYEFKRIMPKPFDMVAISNLLSELLSNK